MRHSVAVTEEAGETLSAARATLKSGEHHMPDVQRDGVSVMGMECCGGTFRMEFQHQSSTIHMNIIILSVPRSQ